MKTKTKAKKTTKAGPPAKAPPPPEGRTRPGPKPSNFVKKVSTMITPEDHEELISRLNHRRLDGPVTAQWSMADLLREVIGTYLAKPATKRPRK